MDIGVFITARMTSKRLPNKHLQKIAGEPAMSWLLRRITHEFSKEIEKETIKICIVTGNSIENSELEALAESFNLEIFYGDDNNIPLRHLQAAEAFKVDAIISVDGDDIFCAREAMRSVHDFLSKNIPLVRTCGLPLGLNAWGYSTDFIRNALNQSTDGLLETGWFRIFDGFPLIEIPFKCNNSDAIRATLDYQEDLLFFDRCITDISNCETLSYICLVEEIIQRELQHLNSFLSNQYWENFNMNISTEKTQILNPTISFNNRLQSVIPGGAHTYSRGFDQFPGNAPHILKRGKGSYVWDPSENCYLDYGMALRAVTLGYANPRVNAAAIKQIENGNNLTRASVIELEAAELFTSLIPGADMVKFAKNGSNVTTAAVKVARAFTGRRYVCIPRQHPFFSFDDWFIGTTPLQRGIPQEHVSSTLLFDYNDITSLKHLFDQYPDQIAAVMLEPATTTIPCPANCIELTADPQCISCPNKSNNFLHQVQNLCRNEGALFILDEMITGFRWSLQGAGHYFNVTPDLMTFGKAMANGFSVAALAGRRDIMEVGAIDQEGAERTFLLSTTHGGEMCGLGAFIETMSIYQESDVCRHLWDYGAKLKTGMNNIASNLGIEESFEVIGPSISLNYVTRDSQGLASAAFRTLFAQEMIKNRVLMPWIAVSLCHTDKELTLTLDACYKALQVYKEALVKGLDQYLVGSEVKPVFRKYN